MDIFFSDADLRRLCESGKEARKQLGAKGAKRLQRRLADLAAASRLEEVVAGRPHPLKGDRHGQFAFDLDGGRRLVLEPACDPVPESDDGSILWFKVTAVQVVFIGDYHD